MIRKILYHCAALSKEKLQSLHWKGTFVANAHISKQFYHSEETGYKLVYFPVRGRAEAIRFMLVDQGLDLEFVDVTQDGAWDDKWKPQMYFGQCPAFFDDGFMLVQRNAILRYLGKKFNMYGTDSKDQSLIDMINDGVEDIRVPYVMMIYTNYDKGKEVWVKDLPNRLTYFEKNLEKFGGKFVVGDKISYADFNLFELLLAQEASSPGCLKEFKLLSVFVSSMSNRPNLQKYLETEGFKNRPISVNKKV